MNSAREVGATNIHSTAGFEELAISPDVDVRRSVARNPLAPPDLLEGLSHDSEKSIRQAVASSVCSRPSRQCSSNPRWLPNWSRRPLPQSLQVRKRPLHDLCQTAECTGNKS